VLSVLIRNSSWASLPAAADNCCCILVVALPSCQLCDGWRDLHLP
jgi:hypothetical protein